MQGPLQVTSQLSGATQGPSSEVYESGEEAAKSETTSRKGEIEPKKPIVEANNSEVSGSGNVQSDVQASEDEVNQAE